MVGWAARAGGSRPPSDEIEKAHPDVFNLLLQVLEDGRLTDEAVGWIAEHGYQPASGDPALGHPLNPAS